MNLHLTLLFDEFGKLRGFHRFERIFPEGTLVDRNSVDIMPAALGRSTDLRKCRQKRKTFNRACPKHRCEFRADIAAQGRIRLFVNATYPCLNRTQRQRIDAITRFFRRQMSGLGVNDQHLRLLRNIRKPFSCHNLGRNAARCKAHAGIQRTGKIICKYQQT